MDVSVDTNCVLFALRVVDGLGCPDALDVLEGLAEHLDNLATPAAARIILQNMARGNDALAGLAQQLLQPDNDTSDSDSDGSSSESDSDGDTYDSDSDRSSSADSTYTSDGDRITSVCRHNFLWNSCRYGRACRRLHLCQAYLRGHCGRHNCWHAHVRACNQYLRNGWCNREECHYSHLRLA